ncbi:MAG TPA: kelch repeat-containing protein [Chloroflexia bacterium]|nr:kelch repeat-containing protein [Chloroflexia bacterium]
MSNKQFVKDALAEFAEGKMPHPATMWPAIRARLATRNTIGDDSALAAARAGARDVPPPSTPSALRRPPVGASLAGRLRLFRPSRFGSTIPGVLGLAGTATVVLLLTAGLALWAFEAAPGKGSFPPEDRGAGPTSLPAVPRGTLAPTGAMAIPRACHAAVLLPNGQVLIAGGMQRDGSFTLSAELYDPARGSFQPTGSLARYHVCAGTALLGTGKVLIAGSFDDPSAELYDPASGTFAPTGSMTERRDGFTTTLLQSGKVLLAGGYAGRLLSSAELYDPATGRFTPTGSMSTGRAAHTATLLPDGRVLVTGGGFGNSVLASAELYDPQTGQFLRTGDMTVARYKHAAVLLPVGGVLIAGGSNSDDWQGTYDSAEIYDPIGGTFRPTGRMNEARFKFAGAVTLLPVGVPLIAGAAPHAEIYDPLRGSFHMVMGQLGTARLYSTATLLADGRVLITGGYDSRIISTTQAWIYTP